MAGCSSTDDTDFSLRSVAQIYNEGRNLMYEGKYKKAADVFAEAERQHPYSWWATQGQVLRVFCFYKANDYDNAVLAAKRFASLHSSHPQMAYVLYLEALSNYERIFDAPRDQQYANAAKNNFILLKNMFPDTPYGMEADAKILFIDNIQAGKNLHIGRFYQKDGNCVSAIRRYKVVAEDFQQTEQIQEGLFRMAECYLAMGLPQEAVKVVAILGSNYPQNVWYRRGYQLVKPYENTEESGIRLSQAGSMEALLAQNPLYTEFYEKEPLIQE